MVRHAELHVGGLIERHEFGEGRGRGLAGFSNSLATDSTRLARSLPERKRTSDNRRGENVAMERDLVTMNNLERPPECYS